MSLPARIHLLAASFLIVLPACASAAADTPNTEVTVSLRPYGAPEPTPPPVRRVVATNAPPFKLQVQPLAEFRPNDTTGLQFRNGASLGADQSGVSGRPGDRSYSAAAASNPAAVCLIPGPTNAVTSDELTVTAWYKPRAENPTDAVNLFNGFASSLLWDAKAKQWVWRIASKDPANPKVLTWYSSGTSPDLFAPGKWTFIAMVWKRGENTARFYMGTQRAAPAEFRKWTCREKLDPAVEPLPSRTLGNDGSNSNRCFNGEIDDVRFFTKALDPAGIATIHKADLQNAPVAAP